MEDLSPKEQYEARKREKEAQKPAATPRVKNKAGFVWILVLLALLVVGGWALYERVKAELPSSEEDRSIAYEIIGQEHIPDGSPRPTYNSNPPTSGPHYAVPAKIGFYSTALPDERVVHNLEHGDVWIAYHPDISASVKEALKDFLDGTKVIITPREANETDIALAAWGRADSFNLSGEELTTEEARRIRDFILRYKNKGPESVVNSGAHLEGEPDE